MKILAFIQARVRSKRLPKKVLLTIEDKTVIEHVYLRLKKSRLLDDIFVLTTNHKSDKKIVDLCKKKKFRYFRGKEEDVLDRYYQAAKKHKAKLIVRITADCPVIDPFIVDDVINTLLRGKYDFCSLYGNFPDGLDCQVFTFKALEKSWLEASLKSDREHVGSYIENTQPKRFKIGKYIKFKNLGHLRLTLDEKKDYIFLKKIYSKLYKKNSFFHTSDIINLLKKDPKLIKINKGIVRNQGYLISLQNEKKNKKY